jgi:hypothetical protein
MSGANISLHDSRVSRALGWFWGIVGTGIAGATLLAANNLYQLNVTVARGLDRDEIRDKIDIDHENRLRSLESDVNTLNGKTFRGVPGYEPKEKEGRRGQ